jgi:glycosyltransferase involved in cell wall biosynthesis
VPNGIADHYVDIHTNLPIKKNCCRLLYVGRIIESKGIKILIEACQILKARAVDFELILVGQFESSEFRHEINKALTKYELQHMTEFTGVLTKGEKFDQYRSADIFCYPTYAESESFGTVLLEAMQFSLPFVASQWRGVCSVVRNGSSGFLVPKKDSHTFADKLELLIKDPDLRKRMGKKGREIYLKEYTLEKFHENMERVFLSLAQD